MTSTTLSSRHRILACVTDIGAALEGVADAQPCFMRTADKAEALLELAAVKAQLAELEARVLATADDVAAADAARDPAVWLSAKAHTDPRTTRADYELARQLDGGHHAVAAGMRQGQVSAAHARVITAAIEDLPGDLDPTIVASAEAHLVAEAAKFRPHELRRIGRHLLDVVAPEIAEAEEAKKLAAQEQRACDKMRLRFHPLGDGTTRITGLLPDATAARLKAYLEAYTNPRQTPRHQAQTDAPSTSSASSRTSTPAATPTASSTPNTSREPKGPSDLDRLPLHQRYAHAFGALLEHLDPKALPEHGGDATTVMVTMTLEQLRTELATAGIIGTDLVHGANLSAAAARRLACTAKLIPAVLDGNGEVLDLGRAQRLFTKAQRRALRLRDQRCRAEGCTIPATWTEAHHLRPWSEGGPTDLANATSLCNWHHHRIHDQRYDAEHLPDGDIRFRRRI